MELSNKLFWLTRCMCSSNVCHRTISNGLAGRVRQAGDEITKDLSQARAKCEERKNVGARWVLRHHTDPGNLIASNIWASHFWTTFGFPHWALTPAPSHYLRFIAWCDKYSWSMKSACRILRELSRVISLWPGPHFVNQDDPGGIHTDHAKLW